MFWFDGLDAAIIEVTTNDAKKKFIPALELANKLLIPRKRHKIAYVTDGATSNENRSILLGLIQGVDLMLSETCFIEADEALAQETKHFTASFIGTLAQEAHVKRVAPFHFSKRYLESTTQTPHKRN